MESSWDHGDEGSGFHDFPGDDADQAGGDAGPPAKRQRVGGTYRLMLLVPGDAVSSLIGKSGSVIKEMESQCAGIISFEKVDEVIMGERLRIVSVFGESLSVLSEGQVAILSQLHAALQAAGHAPPEKPRVRLLVLNEMVGPIIGPKGANINEIVKQTQAFVGFCKAEEMPAGSVLRMCTISGEYEAIAMATQLVIEKQEQLLLEMHKVTSGQMAKVGPNSRAILGDSPQEPPHRHPQPPVPAHVALAPRGAGAPLSFAQPPAPAFAQPPALAFAQPPAGRAKPPPPVPLASRNPPPPPRATATWTPPPAPVREAPPPAQDNAPQMNFTVWLPNDRVGQFIGSRGANIKRITDATSVFISVQKEDAISTLRDFGEGPMRPVLLKGSPEAVLLAHGLVIQIMAELAPEVSFTTVATLPDA
mmetsp:Transcript_41156/g.74358  ORF Transcript_41156/g.74358 Transcript_41156/m.74358 type:complete len:419 (-) Transcript_41156:98-1354(-)